MPATARRRLPQLDPRMLVGIVLVLASIAGTAAVVLSANRTVVVLAAAAPIAPGEALDRDRLALVEVRESAGLDLYLTPESLPEGGAIVTRPVGAGEFVPLSAVGDADRSQSSVVVPISGSTPGGVAAGAQVSLWSAAPSERPGAYETPTELVAQAHVVRLVEHDRMIGGGQVELELRVPAEQVPTVLAAVTNGSRLHVVPLHSAPEERP